MRHLVLYIRLFGRWGWAVLADYISAVTGAYLDLSNKFPVPTWLWVLLLVIGLIIAPFIPFRKISLRCEKLEREIADIRDKQPLVEVCRRYEGKYLKLEIYNRGLHVAKFEVRISNWEGLEGINHKMESFYNARWELFDLQDPRKIDSELKSMGKNFVIVLEDAGDASLPGKSIKYRNVSIPDSRAESFWQAKIKVNEPIRFTVQVLSEPTLKIPFFQAYVLSVNENGEWTKFSEV